MTKLTLTLIITIIASANLINPALADDSVSVGPDSNDDFHTIQAALDASQPGDFISIDDGTYNENLTIDAGSDLTLSGNPFNSDHVVITGQIIVQDGAQAQLDYLTIEAGSTDYGVKVLGSVTMQYGIINDGNYGLLVGHGGYANVYEQTITGASADGIFVKTRGRLELTYSVVKQSNKAGLRFHSAKQVRVTDSTFHHNTTGITLLDANNANNEIFRTNFRYNTTGLRLNNARVSRVDNRFAGNTTNVLELP